MSPITMFWIILVLLSNSQNQIHLMLFGSDQDAAPPTPFFVDAILHGYERASLTTKHPPCIHIAPPNHIRPGTSENAPHHASQPYQNCTRGSLDGWTGCVTGPHEVGEAQTRVSQRESKLQVIYYWGFWVIHKSYAKLRGAVAAQRTWADLSARMRVERTGRVMHKVAANMQRRVPGP